MSNPIRACIYTRVSTIGQVDRFGLKVQEEKCKQMIDFKDWSLTKVYTDAGISGTLNRTKRPGLNQLIEDGKAKIFDCVVIYSLDRLGRRTILVLNLIDQFKEMGIKLVSCKENLDTTTPMGAFFVTMTSAIVQLERDNIVTRTKEGSLQRKKLDGDIGGALPYGYIRNKNNITIKPDEAEIIKLIYNLRQRGLIQVKIVEHLNKNNIPSPKGSVWRQGTISKILKKCDIYKGIVRNNNENGICWPRILISEPLGTQNQRISTVI